MARSESSSGIVLRDWAVFLIAFLVIALDQFTKFLVRATFSPGQSIPDGWPVRLTYYTNTGAAFGLFPDQTLLFIVVAVAAIAIIVFYSRQIPRDSLAVRLGLGLQLGGAIGNLIDRLIHGHVTDFIDVSVWPVFNVADSAIVIGVGLLAYFLLLQPPKQPEPVKAEGTEPQPE